MKRQRQVDVIIPLKANMLATQEAIQLAGCMADKWEAHPSRAEQRIAWVHSIEHMWPRVCRAPERLCDSLLPEYKKSVRIISSWSQPISN